MRAITTLGVIAFLGASSPRLLAQGELYQWSPRAGLLPRAVASAGDVDGDGAADWAVGEAGAPGRPGLLRAFSSSDGGELWSVKVVAAHDWGFALLGLDEADQDGRGDLVTGGMGELRAVSGGIGSTLWQLPVQGNVYALARLDDVDLDGVVDLAAGATASTVGGRGRVYVVSGRTGSVLQSVSAPAGGTGAFGRGVGSLGDFDGDGFHDFAVGDPMARSGAGAVHVVSGDDGRFLSEVLGPVTPFLSFTNGFGMALASPGDLDGDAVPEIAVGSPAECLGPATFEGCLSGSVRLYSGASGSLLLECRGTSYLTGPLSFGASVEAFDDLDADGLGDLLIGAMSDKLGCCIYSGGDVFVLSSATGQVLLRGFDQTTGVLDPVPDVDGDGLGDYLTAAAFFPAQAAVALTRRRPPFPVPTCTPKATSEGCYPSFDVEGAPSLTLGPELSLRARKLPAGNFGLVAWSLSSATTPFGGGTLCLGGVIDRGPAVPTGGISGVACPGSIERAFPKPFLASIAPASSTFYAQAWFRDTGFAPPANFGLTQSMAVTIWP